MVGNTGPIGKLVQVQLQPELRVMQTGLKVAQTELILSR